MKRGRGGLHNERTITSYPASGYHIVWHGNKQGFDYLHGPDGHHYDYYLTGRPKYDISEKVAFWRCIGKCRVTREDNKGLIYKKCNFMLYERDGTFSIDGLASEHLDIPHLPPKSIQRSCAICSCRQIGLPSGK